MKKKKRNRYLNFFIIALAIFFVVQAFWGGNKRPKTKEDYQELVSRWAMIEGHSLLGEYSKDIIELEESKESFMSVSYIKDHKREQDCLYFHEESLKVITTSDQCLSLDETSKADLRFDLFNAGYRVLAGSVKFYFDLAQLEFLLPSSNWEYSFTKEFLPAGKVCFDVDDDCEVMVEERCSLCRQGVVTVVASGCQSAQQKRCAGSTGVEGSPAFFRGFEFLDPKEKSYCFEESPVGVCFDDSKVSCQQNVLVCL